MFVEPTELYLNDGRDSLTGTMHDRIGYELNKKYYLGENAGYYFIIRRDTYFSASQFERVCLYREADVNIYMTGDTEPFTTLVANEARNERTLNQLFADMGEKMEKYPRKNISKYQKYA